MNKKWGRFFVWTLAVWSVVASTAWAGIVPAEPMLRIESGMHTSRINRIGVDRDNRVILTASHDKSLRLWDADDGRLIKTLRIAIGSGKEGNLYAGALSPYGRIAAVGGWTKQDTGKHAVYLIDVSTGEMLRRIGGHPNVITDLAFSPDGRHIAAALYGGNGIRVYRVADGKQVLKDTDYGSQSYGLAFSPDGRLAATCYDGYLRLYDAQFKLIAKKKTPGGTKGFGIAFSPDGREIAMGFNGAKRINIFSADDLSFRHAPDVTGVTKGNLMAVAWSADGRFLYAAGMWQKNRKFPVRRWAERGRGAFRDDAQMRDSVLDLQPRARGGVFIGTGGPDLAALDGDGHTHFHNRPATSDFRDIRKALKISQDGSVIQFGYDLRGQRPARFSLRDRTLRLGAGKNDGLAPPRESSPQLKIEGFRNTTTPTINGTPLTLQSYEISRAVAITPDGDRFLLGADWSLTFFDGAGGKIWDVPTPAAVWGVNISGDGRIGIAAYGDGTLRWYDMANGKELLAFFPHTDGKRWVVWSASGYFDASAGGDGLIGWHLNNGPDAVADFFPASRFKERFRRPDVVVKVLDVLDENRALQLANASSRKRPKARVDIRKQLPPVVSILSPADGESLSQTQVTLRYRVRSPSGEPVKRVKVLIDGQPLEGARALSRKKKKDKKIDGVQTMTITVPKRNVSLALIAENRFAASEPAVVALKWAGRAAPKEFMVKPKLYVLAIGVSKYKKKEISLAFAAKDAQDFSNALKRQKGGLYREVSARVLTDEGATRDDILDGLEWIERQVTNNDVGMVFLAGHGINDDHGDYVFLPHNADPERLRRTGVPYNEIKRTVTELAGKRLFFVDTCHAGNILGGMKRRAAFEVDVDGMASDLASAENGVVVFASSTGRQYSLENEKWNNGAFTKALVEGIGGKAAYHGGGRVTVNMLNLYVAERVKGLTKGRQTPVTIKPGIVPDFPLAATH